MNSAGLPITGLTVTIDPQDYRDHAFVPHGRYQAELKDQLLRSELTGPFNPELLKLYGEKTAPLFRAADAIGPWVGISVFHESMLMSPEAMTLFAKNLAHLVAQGLREVAVAHVAAPSVEGRLIMRRFFADRAFAPVSMHYELFAEEAPARDWVQARLREAS